MKSCLVFGLALSILGSLSQFAFADGYRHRYRCVDARSFNADAMSVYVESDNSLRIEVPFRSQRRFHRQPNGDTSLNAKPAFTFDDATGGMRPNPVHTVTIPADMVLEDSFVAGGPVITTWNAFGGDSDQELHYSCSAED